MRLTLLLLVVLLATTVTGKADKTKKCPSFIKKHDKCLKNGYPTKIKNCVSANVKDLDAKSEKKCKKLEKKLKKVCNYECEAQPVTEAPKSDTEPPKPVTEPPKPVTEPPTVRCRRVNVDFWGANIRYFVSSGFDDCAAQCVAETGCNSITFRRSDNYCMLKSKKGGQSGPSPADGFDSMNMDCDNKPVDMSCQRDNQDFGGADMRNFGSTGIEACANFCRDAQDCKLITFRKSDNNCWLKNKQGGGIGPNHNMISMNMDCDKTPVDMSCQRDNQDFGGADLRNFRGSTIEGCASFCRDAEDCKSITFRKSDSWCWLKHKEGGQNGPSDNNALISMNMAC